MFKDQILFLVLGPALSNAAIATKVMFRGNLRKIIQRFQN